MWRGWLLILCVLGLPCWAAIDAYEFESDVARLRYQSFIDEIRCPKCQNQSISGSNSPIAMDLRRELYMMIQDGRSDKEIIDFMVERYGDFILYRPRVTPVTLLLWYGPAALLIIGFIILIMIVRHRKQTNLQLTTEPLNADEREHLAQLLQANISPSHTAERKSNT
jgi:cytochrome c-type biogenesis protein CcmH